MYTYLSTSLLAVALALSANSLLGHAKTTSEGSAILYPINVKHYEAATGLRRREDDDFSDLLPNIQSQLIYGRPSGKP